MLKYPISTLLYLAKINIKDKIQDALKLHNNIDVRLTATVKDKDGKIIKVHKQHSHSFVANFLAMLASLMYNNNGSMNNYYYFTAINNTWWSYDPTNTTAKNAFTILSSANGPLFGIVIGTGTATPTPNDYALGNLTQNLTYGPHTISPTPGTSALSNGSSTPSSGVLTPSGNTTSFSISRTFQNNSGTSITITEVGIYAYIIVNGDTYMNVLIIHDLLSSPVTVPNSAVLTVTYTISVTT